MDEPEDRDAPRDETVDAKQHRLFARGRDTGRIEYFSDAVIAIAMTLLVLDIRLPHVDVGRESLWAAIGALWQQYFAYALSFAVIAINWVYHHRRYRVIVRYDTTLIWLNLVFLFFIALVPFPTSLLAEYAPDPAAIALYAGMVTVIGALGAANWGYAHRAGLMSPAIDPVTYRFILGNNLVAPIVFGFSVVLDYVLVALHLDPSWAMWFWLLNGVGGIAYGRIAGGRAAAVSAAGAIRD